MDWANLPRLADVILTIDDTNNFGQYELRGLRFQHWATDELRDSCLLDCAKIVLSGSDDTLTVMILRAGGPQKAENTLKQLYADFAKAAGYEYTVDNADFWRDIPPNTWIYSRGWPIFDTSVGTQFGPLVLLIIYNYDICFYEAGERICEGDIGYLSSIPVEAMNLQLNKLRASGYPLQ